MPPPTTLDARTRDRIRTHGVLLLASAAFVFGLQPLVHGRHGTTFRYSVASALVAVLWLTVTLCLAPLRQLSGRRTPLQWDLRRDFGAWAGIMAMVHTLFGLQGHMQGRFWEYFVVPKEAGGWAPRWDLFGLSNDMGLFALLLVVFLLALSNDWAFARLGAIRWKRGQRASYVLFAAMVLHGALFQYMGHRPRRWVVLFGTLVALSVGSQVAGVWNRRRRGRLAAG